MSPNNSLLYVLVSIFSHNFVFACFLCQFEHQTLPYGQTESGKGKCPYDPFQKTASAIVGNMTVSSKLNSSKI